MSAEQIQERRRTLTKLRVTALDRLLTGQVTVNLMVKNAFHALQRFVLDHDQASAIMRFID